MAIIKTSLYLAEKVGDEDPEKRHEYQNQARHQVDRLNDILTDLIEVAKMRGRGMNFRVISASQFIESVYEDFADYATSRNRKLVMGEVEGCCILVSEAKMYRAYTNIVRNAFTYTNDGDTITLNAQAIDGHIHLQVRDTGIGISPENRDKIFERFYRVDRRRGGSEGNQGMGLNIALEIVKAHGGRIDVDSEVGEWTLFSIVLPMTTLPNID